MAEENVSGTNMAGVDEAPVVVEKKKRGRKPNPNKNKMYFSDREENAFKEYLLSNDIDYRNTLFNEILYPAFSKMVESIIRKYTLFKPGEDFEDTFNDVMSHLLSKVEKFDPTKNKKAYSYCGTICKNYALHERQKAQDMLQKNVSYETVFNEANPDMRITYDTYFNEDDISQTMVKQAIIIINKMIEEPNKHNLNESDVKVGKAIVNILGNWDSIFSELESKKYNKSQVDLFIKEVTSLGTKQVRDAKKKYMVAYFKLKEEILSKD